MRKSSQPPRPMRTAAMLLAVLAITTGWVEAASPSVRPAIGDAASSMRNVAVAAHHTERPAPPAPLVPHTLASQRAAQAALFADLRVLFQARALAAQPRATLPAPAPKLVRANPPVAKSAPKAYSGRNHFWFPALGISRAVYTFACTRSRDPDNYVYRWGCAGRNNVYLLGHAWGVFKPLHDAYLKHRLRVGMIAIYADGNGRIRSYRVTKWQVVSPMDISWSAGTSVPSMTLQTCVGLDRLNVRLVAID